MSTYSLRSDLKGTITLRIKCDCGYIQSFDDINIQRAMKQFEDTVSMEIKYQCPSCLNRSQMILDMKDVIKARAQKCGMPRIIVKI